jgi:tRNA nucleotidyltransferase/poly(A) polymerase
MRVAGGWVRDKLLRKQSNDIDIALDDMKGEQFVKLLKDHS